jgi:serine/threonine protein kinase
MPECDSVNEYQDVIREIMGLRKNGLYLGMLRSKGCVGIMMPEFGKSLDDTLYDCETMSSILFPVAQRLFQMNGMHRDIKLNNILFPKHSGEHAQLIDFSLATNLEKSKDFTVVTLTYRAPEILMKMEYTQAVDVWSFGILMLTMLLGKPFSKAYRESDQKALMVDILETFGCSLFYRPMLDYISTHDIAFWNYEKPVVSLEQLILSETLLQKPSSIASPKVFDVPESLKAACDLIRKCTTIDPEKRATWSDVLQDSFWRFQNATVPAKPACPEPLEESHREMCNKLFTPFLRKLTGV